MPIFRIQGHMYSGREAFGWLPRSAERIRKAVGRTRGIGGLMDDKDNGNTGRKTGLVPSHFVLYKLSYFKGRLGI